MDISGKSKSKNQGLYYLYLEVVSIKNSKSQSQPEDLQDGDADARATELFDLFTFSQKDLEFVIEYSGKNGSDVFRQILQSICPSIYGHELVKGRYEMFTYLSQTRYVFILSLTVSNYCLIYPFKCYYTIL